MSELKEGFKIMENYAAEEAATLEACARSSTFIRMQRVPNLATLHAMTTRDTSLVFADDWKYGTGFAVWLDGLPAHFEGFATHIVLMPGHGSAHDAPVPLYPGDVVIHAGDGKCYGFKADSLGLEFAIDSEA